MGCGQSCVSVFGVDGGSLGGCFVGMECRRGVLLFPMLRMEVWPS